MKKYGGHVTRLRLSAGMQSTFCYDRREANHDLKQIQLMTSFLPPSPSLLFVLYIPTVLVLLLLS